MTETFINIEGYEFVYQISNFGKIKRLDKLIKDRNSDRRRFLPEKLLNPHIDSNGYYVVYLTRDYKTKKHYLHKLLAQMFIPNINFDTCVNHIDGNKLNNDLGNLEWCSYSHNNHHAYKTGLKSNRGEKQSGSILKEKDVFYIRKKLENYKFGMVSDLAREFGVNFRTISSIKNNKSWTHI